MCIYLLDITDMCNLTCIFPCVSPFFMFQFVFSPDFFRRKSRWLRTKSQPWSRRKECCWKQISKEAFPNLRKFGKVTLAAKKQQKKNGNGWVLLVVMFFGGIQMEILENVLDETAQFYWFVKCLFLHHWHSLAKGAWLLLWNGCWCQTCCFDMFSWTTCGLSWSNERRGTCIYIYIATGGASWRSKMSSTNFPMGSLALREWGLWGFHVRIWQLRRGCNFETWLSAWWGLLGLYMRCISIQHGTCWAEVLINLLYVTFLKRNQSRKSGSKST